MDGTNDNDNNRYGLRNREHSNHDDVLSINKQRSNDEEKDKEEEEEVVRPQQRRRVDEEKNKEPGETLDLPRAIDFEACALNPEVRDGGHKENNGQRGALCDSQGQGGGGRGRTATIKDEEEEEVVEEEVVKKEVAEEEVVEEEVL